jgi:hypothetical protein
VTARWTTLKILWWGSPHQCWLRGSLSSPCSSRRCDCRRATRRPRAWPVLGLTSCVTCSWWWTSWIGRFFDYI